MPLVCFSYVQTGDTNPEYCTQVKGGTTIRHSWKLSKIKKTMNTKQCLCRYVRVYACMYVLYIYIYYGTPYDQYSTFRMYDATFRMYYPTLLITHQPACNTHQHGEYAPTWRIRTNLHSSISGRMMLTNAGWCVYSHVGAYLHVDSFSPFTNADLKGGTDGGGECRSTLPYGIP